jgi:hypothetical protein
MRRKTHIIEDENVIDLWGEDWGIVVVDWIDTSRPRRGAENAHFLGEGEILHVALRQSHLLSALKKAQRT